MFPRVPEFEGILWEFGRFAMSISETELTNASESFLDVIVDSTNYYGWKFGVSSAKVFLPFESIIISQEQSLSSSMF